jgi:glycosyltransferase involved in cell wall biosynthesis
MARTFHLLTESEPFSQNYDSNISRWVAHVTRQDSGAIVVAPSADESWRFGRERVRIAKGLNPYKTYYEAVGNRLPRKVNAGLLRRILVKSLSDLQAGDTVWVHNQPEFAFALSSFIHARGARLFLHLHASQLLAVYGDLLRACKADCYVFNSRAVEREAQRTLPGLGRTEILCTGVDPRVFHPAVQPVPEPAFANPAEAPANVVFSAHLARQHDLQLFLDAMAILKTRGVPVLGTVVGSPHLSVDSSNSSPAERRRKTPPNVFFESYDSPDTFSKKLRASELFCVPSSWHASASLHMLEAMACGLPILATETEGHHDRTIEVPGVVVIPNAAQQLAHTIQELVEDSFARRNLAALSYNSYAGNFMWSIARAAYTSILASSTTAPHSELEILPELAHA